MGAGDNSYDKLIDETIERHREEILDSYEGLLASSSGGAVAEKSPLPFRARVRAAVILDEVRRRLRNPSVDEPFWADQLRAASGGTRGQSTVNPGESLREGELLCRAILSGIATRLPAHAQLVPVVVRVAVTTHRVIMEGVARAPMAYLGYLLERLHHSHADERRRVARELHDVVAHSVVLALQNLELFALHRDRNPQRAAAKLDTALHELHETVDTVRTLARDLHRSGAEEGLQGALRAYVESLPNGPDTQVRFAGDETDLPQAIRAELFLVLREAARNARAHAHATSVRLDVDVTPRRVRASVVDNGIGFDETAATPGAGLASMRERVALMGGALVVSSKPGRGTAVHVEVTHGDMR
jgi:signal transduction histidine kinase